jgi:hypothetical protein
VESKVGRDQAGRPTTQRACMAWDSLDAREEALSRKPISGERPGGKPVPLFLTHAFSITPLEGGGGGLAHGFEIQPHAQ